MNKEALFFLRKFGYVNLFTLLFLIILYSIFEVISIASIFPLLKFLINPDFIDSIKIEFIREILNNISLNSKIYFTLFFFVFLFFLRSILGFIKTWFNSNLFYKLQIKWSDQLLKNYLTKPYLFHKSKNSSVLIRNVYEEIMRMMNACLIPLIFIISDLILLVPIVGLLLYLNYEYVTIISVSIIFISLITLKFISPLLKKWGKLRTYHSALKYKSLIQSLNNAKDIILTKKQIYFTNLFTNENKIVSKANRNHTIVSTIPKIALEFFLLIALISFIAISILNKIPLDEVIPLAGVFFAAALRLAPISNNILKHRQLYIFGKPTLELMYREYKNINISSKKFKKNINIKKINFSNHILLKKISFFYKDRNQKNMLFKNISLKINKGDFIGIKGESGSGKSTLMDIMLGLIDPITGKIYVDNYDIKSNKILWQNTVSHIPQEIILLDESVKNNIALGEESAEINKKRLNDAIQKSRLDDFIKKLPKKTNTIVGERGSKISGGERQRIGIARALYRNSEVLFLDETTSNLDKKTEIEFLKSINKIKKEKTIILISHSDSALKYCDKIYELKNQKIKKINKN
tara:strand:+ start:5962 stop:7698 length:1737 start_codon:yes stop_codon:yes gene_type:complete